MLESTSEEEEEEGGESEDMDWDDMIDKNKKSIWKL